MLAYYVDVYSNIYIHVMHIEDICSDLVFPEESVRIALTLCSVLVKYSFSDQLLKRHGNVLAPNQ